MTHLHLSKQSSSRWIADLLVQEGTESCAKEVEREELGSLGLSRVDGTAERGSAEDRQHLLPIGGQLYHVVVLDELSEGIHRSSPIEYHHAASRLYSDRVFEENVQDFDSRVNSICSSNGRRRSSKKSRWRLT